MGLVKANMAFYHDSVGSRAHNEVFEVQNQQVCAELEKAGYVSKVTAEEEKAHQERLQKQQEMGKTAAKANEAVSLANHEHNVYANQHTDNVRQFRTMQAQAKEQMQQQQQSGQQAQAQQEQKAARKNDK